MRPHEAIASDVAAIDELAERVHKRAGGPTSPEHDDEPGGYNDVYPIMDNYAPPPFNIQPPALDDEEAGVEAALPSDGQMLQQSRESGDDEAGPSEIGAKRRKTSAPSQRGRGGATKRGRGRGRGKAT